MRDKNHKVRNTAINSADEKDLNRGFVNSLETVKILTESECCLNVVTDCSVRNARHLNCYLSTDYPTHTLIQQG